VKIDRKRRGYFDKSSAFRASLSIFTAWAPVTCHRSAEGHFEYGVIGEKIAPRREVGVDRVEMGFLL
jgi:hypothetical protein